MNPVILSFFLLLAVSACYAQRFRSDGSICLPCNDVPCPIDESHQCICGVCLSDDSKEDSCPSCKNTRCPIGTHQCICGTCWPNNDLPAPHVTCPTCRKIRCPLFTHQCVCGVCEQNKK